MFSRIQLTCGCRCGCTQLYPIVDSKSHVNTEPAFDAAAAVYPIEGVRGVGAMVSTRSRRRERGASSAKAPPHCAGAARPCSPPPTLLAHHLRLDNEITLGHRGAYPAFGNAFSKSYPCSAVISDGGSIKKVILECELDVLM